MAGKGKKSDAVATTGNKGKNDAKRDPEQAVNTTAKKQKITAAVPKKDGKKSKKEPIPEEKIPEPTISEENSASDSEEEVDEEAPAAEEPSGEESGSDEEMAEDVSDDGSDDASEDDDEGDEAEKSDGDSDDEVPKAKEEKKAVAKQSPVKAEKKQVQNPDKKPGSKTLFVGNLSFDVSEENIKDFFEDCGEIIDVRLSQDQDGRFKGFGHVEFADEESAKKAIKKNKEELMGREVKLDFPRERGDGKEDGSKSGKGQSCTIFIRGFDQTQQLDEIEKSLREHFGSCGEITRVSTPTDWDSGGSKGIAYMDFKDKEAFEKALELNDSELGDATLTVEEAKPRNDSGGGGRGRGGGRGGGGGRGFGGGRGHGGFGGGRGGGFGGGRGGGGGRGRGRGGGRVTCKFDHPPPGEAVAKATTTQGSGASAETDAAA